MQYTIITHLHTTTTTTTIHITRTIQYPWEHIPDIPDDDAAAAAAAAAAACKSNHVNATDPNHFVDGLSPELPTLAPTEPGLVNTARIAVAKLVL